MSASVQRDFFIETEENLLLKNNDALRAVANALPEVPVLRPWQIMAVLPISKDTLYKWIKSFKFEYIDLTGGDTQPRYGVVRKSFLAFLATRVNRVS